jgi:hypothetical protein
MVSISRSLNREMVGAGTQTDKLVELAMAGKVQTIVSFSH